MTTTVRPQTWEHHLLSLAFEHSPVQTSSKHAPLANENALKEAYDYCDALTAQHSHSFHLASSLLPSEKRRAMRALYAFCRVSDNIVDKPGGDPLKQLAAWERIALSPNPGTSNPVALAWANTRRRFNIPNHYAVQLLQGVRRDLTQTHYASFPDLATYAYGVASTVGLMSMHIIGFTSQEAIPYAIKLGVALQLTNILRDVAEDWRAGRVYLPAVELADFGLDVSDLAAGQVDQRWRDFMAFQVERNRHLYAEALPGLAFLNQDGRFAVAAAGELYRAILDDIEAHDYDIFSRRAHQGAWGKISRLPGIWWRSRTARTKPARPQLQVEPAS